jgi:hypothetical protein
MCAGAGGQGSESALDWACLEQQSQRRITVTAILITQAIRMAMPATTGTHMPMATLTDTMRGRTGDGATMDGGGGAMDGTMDGVTMHGDGGIAGTTANHSG